jgi:hypothetical protein
MLGILKKFNLLVLFIIMLIGFFLWFNNIFFNSRSLIPINGTLMPLSRGFIGLFYNHSILLQIIAFLLIIFQGIYIIILNKKFIFLDTQTYLPVLIFFFITCIFKNNEPFHPVIVSNIFLMFAFNKVFSSYKKDNSFSDYFEASLLISIGSMFYFYLIFFIIALWLSMMILRSFNFREWLVCFLGLILPYLLSFGYFFLTDKYNIFLNSISANLFISLDFGKWDKFFYITYSFIAFLIIISLIRLFSGYNIKKIKTRKFFLVLAWWLPVVIGISIFRPVAFKEMFFFLSFPISLFISNLFISMRYKWLSELLFSLFFALILLNQFF